MDELVDGIYKTLQWIGVLAVIGVGAILVYIITERTEEGPRK